MFLTVEISNLVKIITPLLKYVVFTDRNSDTITEAFQNTIDKIQQRAIDQGLTYSKRNIS